MTKNERIAELERRVSELETELASLRGQPMLMYGRVVQPAVAGSHPDCVTVDDPIPPRMIPTDNPFIVVATRNRPCEPSPAIRNGSITARASVTG